MKYINFGEPNIGNEEINAVKKVMISKWIGSGPTTESFERKFRSSLHNYLSVGHKSTL